jgi:transcriptional regulator with XRE-family HTH domain
MQNIHSRIYQARKEKGLSLEQLAEKVGVRWQSVQNWENGQSAPKRTRIAAVEKALEKPSGWLMLGEQSEAKPKEKKVLHQLTPREKALIELYNSLSTNQQEEFFKTLSSKKSESNQPLIGNRLKKKAA